MQKFVFDENAPILVELTPGPGLHQAALSPAEIAEKSAKALESAMNTIRNMAGRFMATIDTLSGLTQVEIEFGLKLEAEAGALIAKATTEASMNVKLVWERNDASHKR